MTNQQSLANIHLECFSLRITLANKYGNLFPRAFEILGNCISSSHGMFFFFNDFAEISTSRPQQRRPLRKVPNVTIDLVFF